MIQGNVFLFFIFPELKANNVYAAVMKFIIT